MNSLSTGYPQLIHWAPIALLAINTLGLIGLYFYFKHLFLKDFPGKRKINELQIDVSDFSGMVADLTDRFNRFQNKEGMRAARAAKEQEKSILEQAEEIAAQASSEDAGPSASKADLWNKRRRMQ